MRVSAIFGTTLVIAASLGGSNAPLTQAIQRADGTVSFARSPRLLDASTTYKEAGRWGATYYFTLSLPEDAGEPLGQVTFNQRQGIDDIRFKLEDSIAFEGTRRDKGERLTILAVTEDDETETISVVFDPPVMPGKTFTVGLRPVRNPRGGGTYLFGVTAFPAAEQPYALYLGVGRLQFYDEGRSPLIFP